jgi:hypothetical protein
MSRVVVILVGIARRAGIPLSGSARAPMPPSPGPPSFGCMRLPATRTGWALTTAVGGRRETRLAGGAPGQGRTRARSSALADDSGGLVALIGLAAVSSSILYFASDLIELIQGGFSTTQLVLTYAAEALIPLFVLGLYALQRPQIGRLGLAGALAYAYAFVFFTGTVMYAIIARTSDWTALTNRFGAWITVHSAVMVVAGVMFGVAVTRARALPRWTGAMLAVAMVLMTVATVLPGAAQTAAAGVRDLAFAGMGAALLRRVARGAS